MDNGFLGAVGVVARLLDGRNVPVSRYGKAIRRHAGVIKMRFRIVGLFAKSVTDNNNGRTRVAHSTKKVRLLGTYTRVCMTDNSAMDDYCLMGQQGP